MRPSAETMWTSRWRPGSNRSVVSIRAPQLDASTTCSFPPVLKRACPSGSSADTSRRAARRRSTLEHLHPGAIARDKAEHAGTAGRAKHTARVLGCVRTTQVQRSPRGCPQRREGHQGARIECGCHCGIVQKQGDMRKEIRKANGNAGRRVDTSCDIEGSNAVAVAVHVRANNKSAFDGSEQQRDIGGARNCLRTRERETTREVTRRTDRTAGFDTGRDRRNRGASKDRDEARREPQFYECVAVRGASARGPRAARRAPATRHVGY